SPLARGRVDAVLLHPLALFSFCSSIRLKNIPGISTLYFPARKAVKWLAQQHFLLPLPRRQAVARLWPHCVIGSCAKAAGLRMRRRDCLSASAHLIPTCPMAVSAAPRCMRSFRRRKLHSRLPSALRRLCWLALFLLPPTLLHMPHMPHMGGTKMGGRKKSSSSRQSMPG